MVTSSIREQGPTPLMGESLEERFQNDILPFTLPEPVQVASRLFGHPGEDTRLERVLGVLKNLQPVLKGRAVTSEQGTSSLFNSVFFRTCAILFPSEVSIVSIEPQSFPPTQSLLARTWHSLTPLFLRWNPLPSDQHQDYFELL